ncbi:MAG: S9 family peptidase [Clostridiaceae bacterium]|nr:S9 family peptidase [Clostridiaceae bacterium]
MKELQLNDFLHYKCLSALTFAPGGDRAAFIITEADEERNAYRQNIWLYENGGVRRLSAMDKEGRFVWEDECHLLFPACRTPEEQKRAEDKDAFTAFYRIDIHGGEALPAFTMPFSAQALKPLGDGRWAITGTIDASRPDAYLLDNEDRKKLAEEYREDTDYIVADEIPYWYNGKGDINKRRTALFLFDPAAGRTERLTPPTFNVESFAVKDGCIYYSGEDYRTKLTENADIFRWDGKKTVRLYANKGWGVHGLEAALDGIMVPATDRKRFGSHQNPNFYLLDEAKKSLSLLAENEEGIGNGVIGDCRYGAARAVCGKKDAFYYVATIHGSSHLFCLGRDGGVRPVLQETGAVDDFDVSDKGEVLVVGMYDNRLEELYRVEDGKVRRLTAFNEEALAGKYVAVPEPLTVLSREWEIEGWVLKPRDFNPKKKYPSILDIHGGPKAAYGPIFFHEMQAWASQGYFVFFCNPVGGEGRGNEFADLRGKYGTIDYDNLMDFTDAVLEKYPQIDSKRMAVTGGSYGGYMTNWIVGHTDRFVCAATQRCISNWVSFCGTSDIGPTFGVDQTDAPLVSGAKKMWDASPLKYAENIKTPTLFIHSDEDYRCPYEQALQLFTVLCDRGVPTRLCRFKGENHELSRGGKPKHRIRRLKEITDWIEAYTK